MIASLNQRWRARRDSYRPAGEPINTARHDVSPITDDGPAKAFVLAHHYSASYPAARFRFGLFERARLVGVAVFSHPCNDRVLTGVFPGAARDSVELGRFVLLDRVPGNGETWFLARCFELLRGDVQGVISYSDPVARLDAAGNATHPGHVGTIYQAHNGIYLGRARARVLRLLPDGTTFSDRARQKLRARERGWRYAAAALERFGAAPLAAGGDAAAWLDTWAPRLTRPLRHPGNHRYAWALDRAARRHLPPSQRYPKMIFEAGPQLRLAV